MEPGRGLSRCDGAEPFTGAIELPEPKDEMLRLLRAAVRRAQHVFS